MTRHPEIQLLGESVLLSGLAIMDARRLIARGIYESKRQDGIAPNPRLRDLVAALDSAMSAVGHCDVAGDLEPSDSIEKMEMIGTREAATILRLSSRQVQRIAHSLEGRKSPSRTWLFDRPAVEAYRIERQQHGGD